MSSPKRCEMLTEAPKHMTVQALIRAELPVNTAKRLACLMDVPTETARSWLHRHLPDYRVREIARALLRRYDEETIKREQRRRRLIQMAGLDEAEMLGTVGRIAHALADRADAAADRHEAAARWLAEKASK